MSWRERRDHAGCQYRYLGVVEVQRCAADIGVVDRRLGFFDFCGQAVVRGQASVAAIAQTHICQANGVVFANRVGVEFRNARDRQGFVAHQIILIQGDVGCSRCGGAVISFVSHINI